MKINSARLHFIEVSGNDILDIHELHSLPETDEFNTLGIPENLAVTETVINDWLAAMNAVPKTSFVFCLRLAETNKFIGLIGFNMAKEKYKSAEVWFKLHKDYWNKGYATEALIQLFDFGFTHLKLHRIEAGCAVENMASAKVMEKAGMLKEGMKRKKLPLKGGWKDNYFYAILEEDYFNV
jgi:[ribosomal protein S5]-alanine N-acetyltransferase